MNMADLHIPLMPVLSRYEYPYCWRGWPKYILPLGNKHSGNGTPTIMASIECMKMCTVEGEVQSLQG